MPRIAPSILHGRPRLSADPNFGFVVAAYTLGFLVLGGMILSVVYDYVSLTRALSKLSGRTEASGSDR